MSSEYFQQFHALMVSARTPQSKAQLAERLGINARTITRYLTRLEHSGAKIERSLRGKIAQFRLVDSFQLPGQWFDGSAVKTLSLMLELAQQLGAHALDREFALLQRELHRLTKSVVGSAELKGKILIKQAAQRHVEPAVMAALTRAIIAEVRVQASYRARSDGARTQRTLSPITLELYRNNWYLFSWCHEKHGYRYFALERLSHIEALSAPASVGHAPPKQRGYGIFDLAANQTARLRFSAFRAQWVAEEIWHLEQIDTQLDDARLERSFPFGDPTELLRDLMREGADVEVLAPESLRDALYQAHARAISPP
jgi:proteasome accessory factor C